MIAVGAATLGILFLTSLPGRGEVQKAAADDTAVTVELQVIAHGSTVAQAWRLPGSQRSPCWQLPELRASGAIALTVRRTAAARTDPSPSLSCRCRF